MQKFYYNENQKISGLLVLLNSVMKKFSSKDYDTDVMLLQCLDDCINTYQNLGRIQRESQLQSLRAEFITAQRGINPVTLERQNTRRNEMTNAIAFKVIQSTEQQLRQDFIENENILRQAGDLISQIIIASIQGGLLTDKDITNIKETNEVEDAWNKISLDTNISIGQKRVLLLASKYDAIIMFGDLLLTLKT
jgi:hypothetical protein